MAAGTGERAGLGAATRLVAERARSIVRLELRLAAAELRGKAIALGLGLGLLVASAALGVFAVAFALATAAAALALVLPTWLALLIMTVAIVLLAGTLGAAGVAALRKASPPVPVQALEEARLTTEMLRDGRR